MHTKFWLEIVEGTEGLEVFEYRFDDSFHIDLKRVLWTGFIWLRT
jgi:hypothetical protein